MTLRIATRESPLALYQARWAESCLREAHPGLDVELVPMTTRGDQLLQHSLSRVGGKGLFVKELEQALRDRRADIAVHSMKDVPVELPDGLGIHALLPGDDPRDAFVSNHHASINALPQGAHVGTASLRRQAQLRAMRPDLAVSDLRGNVNTRLARLDAGDFDAILLACAGLKRLGFDDRIRDALAVDAFVPAAGQGIVGIECRDDDDATQQIIAALHDVPSAQRLGAERAVSSRLGGACHVPVAAHAVYDGEQLHIDALVAAVDGSQVIRDRSGGPLSDAVARGDQLAERLLAQGADAILRELGVNV